MTANSYIIFITLSHVIATTAKHVNLYLLDINGCRTLYTVKSSLIILTIQAKEYCTVFFLSWKYKRKLALFVDKLLLLLMLFKGSYTSSHFIFFLYSYKFLYCYTYYTNVLVLLNSRRWLYDVQTPWCILYIIHPSSPTRNINNFLSPKIFFSAKKCVDK